ncbi:MAG: DUF2149 domain-containing protein [Thermodesulfobacterium sp.]|jgi:hypothetical protein|nr:DUF2149 domain-containing protein [Thermodesulfobacterium sp.]
MSLHKKRRLLKDFEPKLEDPLTGIANLFDASVVFIVSLIIALFMAYNMIELLNPKSEVTLVKRSEDGKIEVIIKKGKEIKAKRVTNKELTGEGVKLGTAYQLKDGRIIYVPE